VIDWTCSECKDPNDGRRADVFFHSFILFVIFHLVIIVTLITTATADAL
jgi:hypothetical protein